MILNYELKDIMDLMMHIYTCYMNLDGKISISEGALLIKEMKPFYECIPEVMANVKGFEIV